MFTNRFCPLKVRHWLPPALRVHHGHDLGRGGGGGGDGVGAAVLRAGHQHHDAGGPDGRHLVTNELDTSQHGYKFVAVVQPSALRCNKC